MICRRGELFVDILCDEDDYEDYKYTFDKTELPPEPLPVERFNRGFLQERIERELSVLENPPSEREDWHPDPSFYNVRPYVTLALNDDYKLNSEDPDRIEDCRSFVHVAGCC